MKRWIWPAILFALLMIGAAGIQNWIYYDEASSRSANYARDAKNQIAAECRVPLADPSCATEIKQAARANQRSEYDLYSQKAMALWTGVMGAMAVFGIALSGIGVYLIWRTWDATREAAENSRTTLLSYLAKERAILRPVQARTSSEPTLWHGDGFEVTLANAGASPAHIESVAWKYLNKGFAAWPESMASTDFQPIVVPPGERENTRHLGVRGYPKTPFWLVGTVSYKTLGSDGFACHFCFKVTLQRNKGYGPDQLIAGPDRIAGMPRDT